MEGSEKWPSSGSMLKAKTTGLVDGWERERETEGHTQRDTDTEKDTEREGINPQIYKRKDGTKRVRFIREESKDS